MSTWERLRSFLSTKSKMRLSYSFLLTRTSVITLSQLSHMTRHSESTPRLLPQSKWSFLDIMKVLIHLDVPYRRIRAYVIQRLQWLITWVLLKYYSHISSSDQATYQTFNINKSWQSQSNARSYSKKKQAYSTLRLLPAGKLFIQNLHCLEYSWTLPMNLACQ